MLSKLDVRLRTPSPPRSPSLLAAPWVSQTPQNPTEALSQSTLVKGRIARHQGSSPTPIFKTVAALAKGTERLAHENTLLHAEVRTLREANRALSKRRRAKKTQIRSEQALNIEDAMDLISQKEAKEEVRRDEGVLGGTQKAGQLSERRCGTCGGTGHNARTYKIEVVLSDSSEDELL